MTRTPRTERRSLFLIGGLFLVALGVTVGLALFVTLTYRDEALQDIARVHQQELSKRRGLLKERLETLVELIRLADDRSLVRTRSFLVHEVHLLESLTRLADDGTAEPAAALAGRVRGFLAPNETTTLFLVDGTGAVIPVHDGSAWDDRVADGLAGSPAFRNTAADADAAGRFLELPLPGGTVDSPRALFLQLRRPEGLDLVLGAAVSDLDIRAFTQRETLERLAGITFQNHPDDYMWVIGIPDGLDHEGWMLLNTNPVFAIERRITRDFVDDRGRRFYARVLDDLKAQGAAFSRYWFNKPSTGEPAQKLSYFRLYEPWSWIVGSGIYIDDLSAIQDRRRSEVMATARRNMGMVAAGFVILFGVFALTVLVVARINRHAAAERARLIEHILDTQSALLLVIRDVHVVNMNKRALDFFGYPSVAAFSRLHACVCEFFMPGDGLVPPTRSRWLEEVFRSSKDGRVLKAVMRHRLSNERHAFQIRAAPLETSQSELVVSFTDITEQQRIEEELKASHRALAASNRQLTQFAYAISHDLQEPLRMVISYMDLLRLRLGDRLDEGTAEFLSFAADGAQRMRRMILDLLDYSRLSRQQPDLAPVALADAVDLAMANLRLTIEESGARVEVSPLPRVVGDMSQLVRLFQNLIGNAIRYRHPDRVPEVTVSAETENAIVVVEVADNGLGIAPENSERVFEIFQRLSSDHSDGSGIGLAQCRLIAEAHGGHIWVDSEPDVGSRFRCVFKAVPSTEG